MPDPITRNSEWASRWQASWDRLEERYVPERQERFAFILDLVEAVVGATPQVIDLGCGPGSVTLRLLERLPGAASVGVDLDPVLLAIASATFDGDDRVKLIGADLADPGWYQALPVTRVDAVITTTALHWLSADIVGRLYSELHDLIRPGGLFVHSELMPLAEAASLSTTLANLSPQRDPGSAHRDHWDGWWAAAEADPLLQETCRRRRALFGSNYPVQEFSPPAEWHADALHQAGFGEAGVIWRRANGAVLAALR